MTESPHIELLHPSNNKQHTLPQKSTMLSSLQNTSSSTASIHPSSFQSILPKRKTKKMSITQTYFLAQTARGKLSREAAQADHDLRLLVGHANLLDSVMLELAEAEQEQERWFNQSVSGARRASSDEPKHIKWADTVVEDPEEDWDPEDASDDSDSDSDDSDYDDTDFLPKSTTTSAPRQSPQLPSFVPTRGLKTDEEEDVYDDDYHTDSDDEDLTLTRTPSRQQPPDLLSDSDEESDDESMPPSPPQPTFSSFSEKERKAISTTSFYDQQPQKPSTASVANASSLSESQQSNFFEDGYFLPQRQPSPSTAQQGPMIGVY